MQLSLESMNSGRREELFTHKTKMNIG